MCKYTSAKECIVKNQKTIVRHVMRFRDSVVVLHCRLCNAPRETSFLINDFMFSRRLNLSVWVMS